mmetsp:Transcript_1767/g.1978  ORF Transcript_1767/g.1978 Transcript_1767/m.1978 type:complete len:89 (+) Transcript_1767:260-526(+)
MFYICNQIPSKICFFFLSYSSAEIMDFIESSSWSLSTVLFELPGVTPFPVLPAKALNVELNTGVAVTGTAGFICPFSIIDAEGPEVNT